MTFTTLGYAFLGGLLPSLLWLYFLLREDSRCPEPKRLIALAFVAGMFAVLPAIILEKLFIGSSMRLFALKVGVIEEILKYVMAAAFILWRRAVDETPDYVIYMITVALGFATVENTLFLITPLHLGNVLAGIQTEGSRFLGSTLLHVTASATVGFALAIASLRRRGTRILIVAVGLILAIALHAGFDALIMNSKGKTVLPAYFLVWLVVVIVFAAFEILKYFRYRNLPKNTC